MSRCAEIFPSIGERCAKEQGHDGKHSLLPRHRCHARGCLSSVPPEMLMCRAHWFQVSATTRRQVWAAYRRGQCDDRNPSQAWLAAAEKAIAEVANKKVRP